MADADERDRAPWFVTLPILALLVALLLLVGGLAWVGLRPTPSREPVDAPTAEPETPHATPQLIGGSPKTPAPATSASVDAKSADRPAADAGRAWRIEFAIEGASTWQRAVFLPERPGSDAIQVNNGHRGPAFGEIEVRGPGRLIVNADQRVPWISEVLSPPLPGVLSVTATMERGLSVSGTVVGADGRTPVTDGWVRVASTAGIKGIRFSAPISVHVALDAHGGFHVSGLRPGGVHVAASSRGDVQGGTATVKALAGDADVRVRLRPVATIHLRIFDDETGKAPKTTSIQVDYPTAPHGTRTTAYLGTRKDGEPEPPKHALLKPLIVGKPGTIQIRASGYAIVDLPFEFPPAGGVQRHDVPLIRDEAGQAVLLLTLRYGGGDEPETVPVLRHRGRSFVSNHEPLVDGTLKLYLAPTTTQVTVGSRQWDSEWAAVTIALERADTQPGARIEKDITMVHAGRLRFSKRPPSVVATMTHGGVRTQRFFSRSAGRMGIGALPPGRWTFRIEGNETWVGEADIRSGETTDATWSIEAPRKATMK